MARKQQRFAAMMTYVLQEQGASAETAILAPQIALACYKAGRELASGDPAAFGRACRQHSTGSAWSVQVSMTLATTPWSRARPSILVNIPA